MAIAGSRLTMGTCIQVTLLGTMYEGMYWNRSPTLLLNEIDSNGKNTCNTFASPTNDALLRSGGIMTLGL